MSHKKKILFIINPKSGIGRQKIAEIIIPHKLDLAKYHYEISYTQYPHHAVLLAKEAAEKKYDVVVAVGGDGSANDVAQGIVNTNTALGIIPVGSGNGLAHHLKISSRITRAIKTINRGKTIKADTGTLNGKLFISIAGLGFDAKVAEKFSRCKYRGLLTYIRLIISEFYKYTPIEYTIEFDQQKIIRKALLVSFANADQFGYNARIAPSASINDGYLDLCILKKESIIKTLLMVKKLFMKNIDDARFVELYKVKNVTVTCKEFTASHLDGDADKQISRASIQVHPKTLSIIVP